MKHTTLHFKQLDEASRSVECIASNGTIDSYGESLDPTWNLKRYSSNPIVLLNHNSRSLPIGRAENVRVEGGALKARIFFAPASANAEAESAWQLVKARMLNCVSVGFVPGSVRTEMRDGRSIDVLSDNELHEISVVSIPANPDATILRSTGGHAAPLVSGEVGLFELANEDATKRAAFDRDDPRSEMKHQVASGRHTRTKEMIPAASDDLATLTLSALGAEQE